MKDKWNDGSPYEYFMGRWSKLMAPVFLKWLNMPPQLSCLEVGCGTGALSEAIYEYSKPKQFCGIDPSNGFITKAKERLHDKGTFIVGNVIDLPFENATYDFVVSGLALNFFPNLEHALSEMKRVARPNGTIAAYVWDYSGRMEMLRYFWDTAISIDPASRHLDEGIRFPICNSTNLENAFQLSGLKEIKVKELDILTVFKNFEDYWNPFLGAQGPAPSYLASLSKDLQSEIKNDVYNKLPKEPNGEIRLVGRAIVIKGISN